VNGFEASSCLDFWSERVEPNAQRFVLRNKQLGRPLRVSKMPIESPAFVSAIVKLNRSDDDSTGQLIAGNVVDSVLGEQVRLFCWSQAGQARIDIDSASNIGGTRPVLDSFSATHDGFSVGLPNGQGSHALFSS
jgi:hypothetical protein